MKAYQCALLALPVMAVLNSCETTGDPTAGGIFWSEKKAQQRLADRQDRLDTLNEDTRRKQNSAAAKESQIRSLQQ